MVTSYFFLLLSSSARLLLNTCLTLYVYAVLAFFSIIDFVADIIGTPDESGVGLSGYAVEGLSAEQEEALYLFDTVFVPYVRFYHDVVFSGPALKAFWFLAFIVPFSHFTGAVLSNEYLLFCCITFSLFILYDQIVNLLSGVFAPSLDILRQSVSKKLILLAEITAYQTALIAQYTALSDAFEELVSDVAPLDESVVEADYVVFDQALVSAATGSVYAAFLLESQADVYYTCLENAELDLIVLEEAIAELLLDEAADTVLVRSTDYCRLV